MVRGAGTVLGSSRATYKLSNKATMVVPSPAAAGSLDMVRSEGMWRGGEGVYAVAVVYISRGRRIIGTCRVMSINAPIELLSEPGAVRVRDLGNRRMYKIEVLNGRSAN